MTDEANFDSARVRDRVKEILLAQIRGESGPGVNHKLLKRYFAGELKDDQAAEVDNLATKYEPWGRAFFEEAKNVGWYPKDLPYPGDEDVGAGS